MPQVTFILVRPEYPGNIGQSARAIANFGYDRLTVVAPKKPPIHREALQYAMKAQPILERALVVRTVAEATKECTYVIGTSRRFGRQRRDFVPLPELPQLFAERPADEQIGVLFGSELKGLTNDELAHCQRVITIPTHPKCPSMNLSHAVTVVAYTLGRTLTKTPPAPRRRAEPTVTHDLLDGMFTKLEAALEAIGFFEHGSRKKVLQQLRHLFHRSNLTYHEAQMLWAIWQRVLWTLTPLPHGSAATPSEKPL